MFVKSSLLALALALSAPVLPARAEVAAGDTERVAESYKLPITAPQDQGDTGLCWVYAALSMLETNYLASHPGSDIALSRAALQRFAVADRFQRQITGNSDHLEDGGLAVEALLLIRQNGLLADGGASEVANSGALFAAVSSRLAEVEGADAKLKALDAALAADLGPAPAKTLLDGKPLTPADLAKAVLGDRVWREYDIASEGAPRVGPSSDPDARPETQVHYIGLPQATALIHDSLKRGEAVVWGSVDHALMIYGGDYDAEGKPLAYWIKDSFAPYTYRAPADEIHAKLNDVTVTAPRVETARN